MYKIYSSYNCILKYNNHQEFLDINNHISFDDLFCEKIEVYPVGKHSIYSFILNIENLENNKFYKVKKIDNVNYIFLLDKIITQTENIHPFKIEDINVDVFISNTALTFKTSKEKKELFLPYTYKSYFCEKKHNLLVCNFEINEKENLLVIYNAKTKKIKSFHGDIDFKDNGFILKNKLFDSEYVFSKDGLKINSFVEKEKNSNKALLSYNFINSIYEKNYDYSHRLLSPQLQEKISIRNLKEFLPNIKYFQFVEKNKCFAICEADEIFIDFIIENDKIVDLTTN